MSTVHDAPLQTMDALTLYRVLALRSEVFVVEQDCVYQDLDGRDLEPEAQQLWIADGDHVIATLRLLRDPAGQFRIGRVATAMSARGKGLAADLMRRALKMCGDAPVVLNAQSYLRDWYARFGFVQDGEEYDEDGIAHIPMRLVRAD